VSTVHANDCRALSPRHQEEDATSGAPPYSVARTVRADTTAIARRRRRLSFQRRSSGRWRPSGSSIKTTSKNSEVVVQDPSDQDAQDAGLKRLPHKATDLLTFVLLEGGDGHSGCTGGRRHHAGLPPGHQNFPPTRCRAKPSRSWDSQCKQRWEPMQTDCAFPFSAPFDLHMFAIRVGSHRRSCAACSDGISPHNEAAASSPAGPMASAKETYRTELRSAARQLGERCLYSAAKWYTPSDPSISRPLTLTSPSPCAGLPSCLSASSRTLPRPLRPRWTPLPRRTPPPAGGCCTCTAAVGPASDTAPAPAAAPSSGPRSAACRTSTRPSQTMTRSTQGATSTCSPRLTSTAASTAAPRTCCRTRAAARPCSCDATHSTW
jgi:hypothetical protein